MKKLKTKALTLFLFRYTLNLMVVGFSLGITVIALFWALAQLFRHPMNLGLKPRSGALRQPQAKARGYSIIIQAEAWRFSQFLAHLGTLYFKNFINFWKG